LVVVSIVLAACGPTPTEAPATAAPTEEVAEPVEEATEAPVVESTDPGPDTGKVFIMGAFRGSEETAFTKVIEAFEAQNPDIDVLYSGSGEFETLITVRVEAGDPPDIAAFPQPGAVAKLAREGELVPLWDEALALYDAQYTPAWKELSSVDGVPYGLFHRVNAKGWVWYNKPAFEAAGYTVPETWDELMTLTEEMKGSGIAPWCDGIESERLPDGRAPTGSRT
jgi:alpha-glucoside transport system substrate-binding protein